MTDFSNQDNIYLNENRNYRFNRIPLITPTLSKIMKNRVKNNLAQRKNIQRGRDKLFFDLQRNSINNQENVFREKQHRKPCIIYLYGTSRKSRSPILFRAFFAQFTLTGLYNNLATLFLKVTYSKPIHRVS